MRHVSDQDSNDKAQDCLCAQIGASVSPSQADGASCSERSRRFIPSVSKDGQQDSLDPASSSLSLCGVAARSSVGDGRLSAGRWPKSKSSLPGNSTPQHGGLSQPTCRCLRRDTTSAPSNCRRCLACFSRLCTRYDGFGTLGSLPTWSLRVEHRQPWDVWFGCIAPVSGKSQRLAMDTGFRRHDCQPRILSPEKV